MFNPTNIGQKAGNLDWNGENDSVFTSKEEFTTISKAVIGVAEQEFSLLTAFPVETVDGNKKKYEYTTLSEVGDAAILQKPSDFPALSLNGTLATVDVPWKGIGFELQKEDIANSKNLGQKLDTLHAKTAGKKVRKLQDEALYSKTSAFGTLGIAGQATGSFAGANWTTTTTNIYDQIRQIFKAVPAAWSNPSGRNVLILHRDQANELLRDSWDNGTAIIQVSGGSFAAKVAATWPQLRIIESQWVTAGTGIFYPFNEDIVRRVVGVTPRVIEWDQNPMEIQYVALARDVLIVPTPSAVIAITGI